MQTNQPRPGNFDRPLDRHFRSVEGVEPDPFDSLTLDPPYPRPFGRVFRDADACGVRTRLRPLPESWPARAWATGRTGGKHCAERSTDD
jgi:hypothetical protein